MAYLKITDIDGKEHELQVINEDRDILISRGFGKFLFFKEMENSAIEDYLDKISDLKYEVERMRMQISNLPMMRQQTLNDEIAELKKEVSIYKERAEIIIPGMK
jgi:chaperonin cofactor prefoldin